MFFEDEYYDTWSIANIKAKPVHDSGNTGAGIKIGIIDSGISNAHTDLRVAGEYDFVNNTPTSDDVYGHGTHVAGTACATVNVGGAVGVAPACELYDLRVLNDAGSGTTDDILAAVNWAVANDLDIINLSLGRSTDMGTIAEATFAAAYDAGVLIVAAAGNSGTVRGKGINTIYPANYASVMGVAATDQNNVRASFSSTGDEVEISAPGAGVHSTWNDADSYSNPQPVCDVVYGCYKDASGTSMASPQVAGVAALIMAAGVRSNTQVREILKSTATSLGSPKLYGAGLVNAEAAIASIGFVSNNPVADAGVDQNVMLAEGVATIDVTLDGSGSNDNETIVSYEWSDGFSISTTGVSPVVTLGVGNHTLTLTVTDNANLTDTDTVLISVSEYQVPVVSNKFQIGDRVKTQGRINVRDNPAGNEVGDQKNGEGTIVGGPVFAADYWWWEVNYTTDPDGWSVENWLRLAQ
jgi:subtilisin